MVVSAGSKRDPLTEGYYTIRDAARFLKTGSTQKLRGWLCGHVNSSAIPVIERTHQHEISFLDLIEMRFIEYYRQKNIPLQTLRVAAKNAREVLKTSHPFALRGVRFMTERKKIFLETATVLHDKNLINLLTKQYEIYQVIEQLLDKGITFDRETGLVSQWHPDQNVAPNVYLDPHHAFGQPVVGEEAIATSAIFRTYKAEKGNKKKVADWYGIPQKLVSEAVEFEVSFAA